MEESSPLRESKSAGNNGNAEGDAWAARSPGQVQAAKALIEAEEGPTKKVSQSQNGHREAQGDVTGTAGGHPNEWGTSSQPSARQGGGVAEAS
eukprot:6943548-Pyramimonas_sp.AAC.1